MATKRDVQKAYNFKNLQQQLTGTKGSTQKIAAGEALNTKNSKGFFGGGKSKLITQIGGVLLTVGMINALSGNKGQMTNAQLYGQDNTYKNY